MKLTPEELAQNAQGQLAVLTNAVRVMLMLHPRRDEAAVAIHEGAEQLLARIEPNPFPQAFVDGMYQARSKLLKPQEDPGQPRMS